MRSPACRLTISCISIRPTRRSARPRRFTAYHAAGFGQKDQERLQQTVIDLASRGASVLLSNSASPEIERLYGRDSPAHHAGLEARRVPARRAINSQGASRGPVDEYLITNVSGGPIAADGRLR